MIRAAVQAALRRIAAAERPADVSARIEGERVVLEGPLLTERRIGDARLRGFGGLARTREQGDAR